MTLAEKAEKLAKRAERRRKAAAALPVEEKTRKPRKARATVEQAENTQTVRDRVRAKAANMIADLNTKMDEFLDSGMTKTLDFQGWMIKNAVSPSYRSVIAEYFRPQLMELTEVEVNRHRRVKELTDGESQLVEMYSNLSMANLKAWKAFLASIVEKEDRKTAKAKEKAREVVKKTKTASANVQTSDNVRFAGAVKNAKEVWTWNPVYNHLTRLVGNITLDGRKFLGVDVSKSVCYTINKPDSYLAKVKAGKTTAELDTVFANIGKTPRYLRQKLQETAIILKVIN